MMTSCEKEAFKINPFNLPYLAFDAHFDERKIEYTSSQAVIRYSIK